MKPWPVAHADVGVVIFAILVVLLIGEVIYIIRNR